MGKKISRKQIENMRRSLRRIGTDVRKLSGFNLVRPDRHNHIQVALSEVSGALDSLESAMDEGSYPAKKALERLRGRFDTLSLSLTRAVGPTSKVTKQDWRSLLQNLGVALGDLAREIEGFDLPRSRFQEQLDHMLAKYDLTPYALATMTGIDPSYMYKLKNGYSGNPGKGVLRTLSAALLNEFPNEETKRDIARLCDGAGYPLDKRSRTDRPLIPSGRIRLPWH